MRVALMSDIHLEHLEKHHTWVAPRVDADVLVLAGDTHPGVKGVIWAHENYPDQKIIMIAGNHEFYGKRKLKTFTKQLQEKAAEFGGHIEYLEDQFVDIDGVRFIGSTLWTDYNISGNQPLSMMQAQMALNDFTEIFWDQRGTKRPDMLRPMHLAMLHMNSKQFITDNMTDRTVVVTHHAPSEKSLGERTDALRGAYASNLENLICYSGPKYWLHGHTHRNVDYTLCDTRVLANMRGYEDGPFEPVYFDV